MNENVLHGGDAVAELKRGAADAEAGPQRGRVLHGGDAVAELKPP